MTTTTTEAGLLAAALAEPAEDAVRLVYADHLEEQGESGRARLIRTQVYRASGRTGYWPFPRLRPRRWFDPWWPGRSRWTVYNPSWDILIGRVRDASEPGIGDQFRVTRGFVSAVTLSCTDWLRHGPRIVRCQPVTRVTLTGRDPHDFRFPTENSWGWLDADRAGNSDARARNDPALIPTVLFELAKKLNGGRGNYFATTDDALESLSAATLLFAREKEPGT